MKNILIYLIFVFNFQSLVNANDIKDFAIEGMSVDDSLLKFYSNKKISDSKVDWYDDLEKEKYISYAFESDKFQTYDFVDVWVKYNDKDLKIDTIAGVLYFGDNKLIKDIDDCYISQKKIAEDLMLIFKNAKKNDPYTNIFYEADPSGKSSYTDIYLDINLDYSIGISCYDWSDEFLGTKDDHLYVTIKSNDLDSWLN